MTNQEPIKITIHAKLEAEDPLYVLISFYQTLILHELTESGVATRDQIDRATDTAFRVLAAMHQSASPEDKEAFLDSTFRMLGTLVNHLTEATGGNPRSFFGPTMAAMAEAGGLNVASLHKRRGEAAKDVARRAIEMITQQQQKATAEDLALLAELQRIQGQGIAESEAEESIMRQAADKLAELRQQQRAATQPETVAEQFMGDIWGDD
jgi:hypothetical protein